MISLTAAPTTSTVQVPNSSTQNTSLVGLFSNNHRRTICPCPCSFTSCSVKYSYSLRSVCNPIKAMAAQETAAEIQFVPKPDSQFSSSVVANVATIVIINVFAATLSSVELIAEKRPSERDMIQHT
ncbi:hypothetical protein TIFTF001_054116 [Ficus carica]|uniref:Uncharacterized protein n=1 Tax=Ficus carica TaxID=3494 RepID=A0AA88EKS8_FICCA|nr:hypothetical protein TIFTF001_054116 [Ficus carica]